jgi:hypothetical protein
VRRPVTIAPSRDAETEAAFWIALDWGAYRTLSRHAGLDDAYEAWLRRYHAATLLDRRS